MRFLRSAVFYAALALGANAAAADTAALQGLRTGDMEKLNFSAAPAALPDLPITDAEGATHHLADYKGKYVVVNFWATWCAPCRKEMSTLDQLQAEMGDRLAVVPVATMRNTVTGVQKFFAADNVTHLPVLLDPDAALARSIGIMGLPVTLILNPEGQEVARLIGQADWSSDSAKAILTAMMAGG
ncbi:MAG: redoxin domain-containing protein [Rhodobacteraceae bacterium]|nr:redoxin domain-containing protein [Paracoccaceae bacterium]